MRIELDPWKIELHDPAGGLITRTLNLEDFRSIGPSLPFAHTRRLTDMGRSSAACFELAHDEMIFGCGESFTRFNKRGQKINAYTGWDGDADGAAIILRNAFR